MTSVTRHCVYKWSPQTNIITIVDARTGDEGSDAESLSYPTAVWVDDEAQVVYVADSSNNRIQRWLPNALIDDTVAGGA
ncbi:unnamed protein product, partial [Rotaria sp. Silwood1]